MREILFRGKRVDNGERVEGFYVFDECALIVENLSYSLIDNKKCQLVGVHPVISETVGQFTGLYDNTKWEELATEEQAEFLYPDNGDKRTKKDWKGKPIFEGDIVKTSKGQVYEIKMRKGAWVIYNDKFKHDYEKWDFLNTFATTVKVIGNIHDNPELLKEREG